MKLSVETAAGAGRHQSAAAGQDREAAGRRPAHRRAGAQLRSGVERRCEGIIRGAVGGAALRRFAAAAQHGHHRRQPAAAHALRLLPRAQRGHARRLRLQQAHARHGLRGAGWLQPHACDSGHQRALHRDAPLRHVRGDGGARGGDSRRRARRASGRSRLPSSTSCPATRRKSKTRWSPASWSRYVDLPKPVDGREVASI